MSPIFARTLLSFALVGTFAATSALAAPARQSTIVRTADLDLATNTGEQALRTRIARAVSVVCGDVDQRDLNAMASMTACRAIAMANAAPQMEVAIANAHNGKAYAANNVKVARTAS
ncbi:MAG: UrcA family protein [Sphingomonas bacterium]|jgi:UrcA family protein|nr:UrcA family protein [Sphingomonas bacterium]